MEGDVPVIKDLATLEEEQKERMLADLMRISCKSREKESITKSNDNWRTDLHKASSLRWYGKLPENPEEALTLRYKIPEWPHQKPLWHTLTQIPKLTYLILDRSELSNLRELGSSLQSLLTLSICNCGLKTLDGTFAFPNLRTLIASDNKLTNPSQCSYLEELQHLDLCANPINSYDGLVHLSLCPNLRSLHLNGTPISKQHDFQTKLKGFIPQLKELYPGGYRENPEDEAADLDAFIQRNVHIIGSSYTELKSKKHREKKKKTRKNKEMMEIQETSYQDVPPEGLSDSTVHLKPSHFLPSLVSSARSLSATSGWSISTSNDPVTPIHDLNFNRTDDEKD